MAARTRERNAGCVNTARVRACQIRSASRPKVLVHDGIGIWLAARAATPGSFVWSSPETLAQVALSRDQLDALVLGLPWQRIGAGGVITVV